MKTLRKNMFVLLCLKLIGPKRRIRILKHEEVSKMLRKFLGDNFFLEVLCVCVLSLGLNEIYVWFLLHTNKI